MAAATFARKSGVLGALRYGVPWRAIVIHGASILIMLWIVLPFAWVLCHTDEHFAFITVMLHNAFTQPYRVQGFAHLGRQALRVESGDPQEWTHGGHCQRRHVSVCVERTHIAVINQPA